LHVYLDQANIRLPKLLPNAVQGLECDGDAIFAKPMIGVTLLAHDQAPGTFGLANGNLPRLDPSIEAARCNDLLQPSEVVRLGFDGQNFASIEPTGKHDAKEANIRANIDDPTVAAGKLPQMPGFARFKRPLIKEVRLLKNALAERRPDKRLCERIAVETERKGLQHS
jgi:hypothetical protein